MALPFRSFRTRLLVFVLGLLIVVQSLVLLAVNRVNVEDARNHVDEALRLTAKALRRTLDLRNGILLEKAQLLSADFAFKQAVATGETATIRSALENHRDRVSADVMMLVAMDGMYSVDTLHPDHEAQRCPLEKPVLLAEESEFGEADAIEFVDGVPYQLVVVPLFTPEPTAWILIGFVIDDDFAGELREETGTHVSLLRWNAEGPPFASTLPPHWRDDVSAGIGTEPETETSLVFPVAGVDHVTWVVPIRSAGGIEIAAVLQRSLSEALAPYLRLRDLLLLVFGLGLLASLVGGSLTAAQVTRPVEALARAARRVSEGDYDEPVQVAQRDELGLLASSFNDMMKGLSERDRVRDLLGKVVSPEVAEELLSHGIELGGEERRVSVLFSDVRNFTSLSETKTPQELVDFLNAYLTGVSAIVERHGGVVDKYIGDAVMAIFGAPLALEDDAPRAVRTAMEMTRALGADGPSDLAIGVGVNTDVVVAGNMGSRTRLNYTVIGDGVNLASRLEGLTKRYGVGVLVSETTRDACPDLVFRELDRVQVKGQSRSVRIFEPVGEQGAVDAAEHERLARHAEALALYQAGRFSDALRAFEALARPEDAVLLALYRERIERLRREGVPDDWDGTFRFDEK
ncbi:MAG: HAMP domain-containing protein [Myxococcales bacterium]|nr:HAMP domain-containing protein [Myxococcales bacterium]